MLHSLPNFFQPFDGNGLGRAQLLREERHAQLLQQPAHFFQARIVLAFALCQQTGVALLLRAQLGQFLRVARAIGADFV